MLPGCEIINFEFRNCPSDSHPSGGFPVSNLEIKDCLLDSDFLLLNPKFAIRNLNPMLYALCLSITDHGRLTNRPTPSAFLAFPALALCRWALCALHLANLFHLYPKQSCHSWTWVFPLGRHFRGEVNYIPRTKAVSRLS